MGYEAALKKSWDDLATVVKDRVEGVVFLGQKYDVDISSRSIIDVATHSSPKVYVIIIILHYLLAVHRFGGAPEPSGEWISFNQLDGADAYYPTFKKRTIDILAGKCSRSFDDLVKKISLLGAERAPHGDAAFIIKPFHNIPVLITLLKGDDEFAAGAEIHFDRFISKIFCTEDIIVMTEILVHGL